MGVESVNLDEWVLSGGGAQGDSYFNKSDDSVMLKLFAPHLPLSLVEGEFSVSSDIFDAGLPCIKPVSVVTDGTRYGMIVPRLKNKISFCTAVGRNPECLDDMAGRLSRIGRLLHTTPADRTKFRSALSMYRDFLNASKSDDKAFLGACDGILAEMEHNDSSCTFLHGDFHYGNMITDGVRDYMIDLGAFAYGNPLFDLSLFYIVTHLLPDGFTGHIYHITEKQALDFWDAFKKHYFKYCDCIPSDDVLEKQFAPYMLLRTLSFERDMGIDGYLLNYRKRFLSAL